MARPKKNTNPQALADKMRKAVLQAAIEGKLTEQHQDDGDARELIAQIETEKQRLVKAGEIKRQKSLPDITEEEKLFDIPDSWEWVRLDQLSIYIQRGRSPKYSTVKEIPVISQKCVQWDGFSIELAKFIDPETKEKYQLERFLQDRDLMWNSTGLGTVGRVTRYKAEANKYGIAVADSHITVVRLIKQYVLPEYIELFIASPIIQQNIEDICSGSTKQKELATSTVKETVLPLPPLAEQQRIVTKLEEVMPQLDSLKADENALHALQTAFPRQMQASLLQAAIEGKLTQQDATKDGHASDLLAEIESEKQRLIQAGEIKRQKSLPPIIEEEKPFDIPDNWEWVRLGGLISVSSGQGLTKSQMIENAKYPVYGGNGINGYFDDFLVEKDTLTIGRVGFYCGATHKTISKSWVTDNALIVSKFSDDIDTDFLHYFLNHLDLKKSSVATAQPVISGQRISQVLLPLPPLAEQQRIVDLLERALPEIQTLKDI